MKITIDRDRCCGAGQCVLAAPDVFDQDDEEGLVIVLQESPAPEQHQAVREAASVCPTATIEVTE
ncbi:ferredoxin [Amycolatopsis magusensis]|uniref:Ferredoxin n=1 Tax=Amycolatopsis magusensis TaxID=882444 RepID=A0ABS4PNU4_9PSEU|nr:ferredoxin [Amycolatopsis magusensis]MBP2181107.1 ferredoxin [Amycolatopsis magusensis]MDI5974891.1 ferredoxin [Amycolatopsis magusensis]UJW32971.1 ferredoxin [Saccharothrix sp. AJ9571]